MLLVDPASTGKSKTSPFSLLFAVDEVYDSDGTDKALSRERFPNLEVIFNDATSNRD